MLYHGSVVIGHSEAAGDQAAKDKVCCNTGPNDSSTIDLCLFRICHDTKTTGNIKDKMS